MGGQRASQLRLLTWISGLLTLGSLARAAEAGPAISIAPTPIVFYGPPMFSEEGAPPGEYQSGWYEVRNVGDAPLVVAGMAITGADAAIMAFDGGLDPFCGSGQTCAQTFSLAPGASRSFPVTCTAAQAGFFAASLGVTSNAVAGTSTAAMSCLGLRPPILQIAPSPLDFGTAHQCDVGEVCGPSCATRPLTQTLAITNAAAPPSRLDFHLTPTLPSGVFDDFIVGDMCPQDFPCSVAAGAARLIEITFRPRKTRVHDTPITLVSLFPGQASVPIPFYAEGGHGSLAFDTPDFLGKVGVGQTLTTTLTVHNAGRSCLSFSKPVSSNPAIQIVGAYPDDLLLQAGESYSWTVSCTPSSVGVVSALLDFELAYEGIDLVTQTVTCEGVASTPPVLQAKATPAALDFGAIAAAATSTQPIELHNTGNQPLLVNAVTLEAPADFTVTGIARGAAIAAGASLGFEVHAAPAMLGRHDATLVIDLDAIPDLRIPLDAIAVDPALVVTTIDDLPDDHVADLGDRHVGIGTKVSYVTLRNAGAAPIAIATCAIAGDPELGLLSGCPVTIPGDTAVDLEVAFTPAAAAESTATLTLTGTGFATGSLRLLLRGRGVDPPFALLGPHEGAGAPDARTGGGCSTGGPAPDLALALGAALLLARRRRRRRR